MSVNEIRKTAELRSVDGQPGLYTINPPVKVMHAATRRIVEADMIETKDESSMIHIPEVEGWRYLDGFVSVVEPQAA
jgi:hypothetical protein